MKCDLHMHSFNSKWKDHDRVKEMTASEYVDILIKNGVNVFSVTDHDCFSAKFYNSIKAYIKDKPISVIFGFEADIYVNESDFFRPEYIFLLKLTHINWKELFIIYILIARMFKRNQNFIKSFQL